LARWFRATAEAEPLGQVEGDDEQLTGRLRYTTETHDRAFNLSKV
jgi:hypothetical protein